MKGSGIMKKNLEETQVKVANKRAILESHDGEEFSPITVAKNVLCEDGATMQDYFDNHSEPNISTKIVNSNSMSKVGQGDNVDFSDNVMNGAYEDVVLKGRSLVNVIQGSSKDKVVLPYSFEEGERVTINDTHVNGRVEVEVKGRTLVNVHQQTLGEIILPCDKKYRQYNIHVANNPMLVTNRTYLYILDIKKNTANSRAVWNNNRNTIGDTSHISYPIEPGQMGRTVFKVNFKDLEDKNNHRYNWFEFVSDLEEYTGEIVFTLNIIEYQDGMENWDIPYFTGMQSVKMPILHSVNQMFDYSLATTPLGSTNTSFSNDGRNLKVSFETSRNCYQNNVGTLLAGTYEVSYEIRGHVEGESVLQSRAGFLFSYSSQSWWNAGNSTTTHFNNMSAGKYIKVTKTITISEPATITIVYHGWSDNAIGWCEIKDIRIVPQGKSSILSLPEEVVLRSLPNGVCDTFNTRTGVYIQRIGEVVLNGGEDWRLNNTEGTTTQRFFCSILTDSGVDSDKKGTQQFLCDGLKTITWSQTCELGVTINGDGVFVYNNSIEYTVSSVKQWLSQTPVKLQYELATPVITKINLSSTLKSWNTTTHVYSEIPENTLYPTLTHSNPTYPVILKPSTKYSIVANSYSNSHTNSPINFNLGGATASTTVGNRVTTITTPSTLSNELLTMSGRGNKLNNVMVIEGDVVGDEPYFEGMCDSKSPILSNVGKNLLDIRKAERRGSTRCSLTNNNDGSITLVGEGDGTGEGIVTTTCYASLKQGKTYTYSFESDGGYSSVNGSDTVEAFLLKDGSASTKIIQMKGFTTTFTCQEDGDYYVRFDINKNNTTHKFWNVYLAEVSTDNSYEPYKSNTTTFASNDDEIIVLRSLPNSVCDTLNVRTGEYVQNIGEIVLDGSDDERWAYNIASCGQGKKCFNLPSELTPHRRRFGYIICDCMPTTNTLDKIGVYNGEGLNILIDSDSNDVNVLKEILASNPITVQYELATPIVKQVNVEGYPYAYENGHVLLESSSQEQSLTPTIEYSIVANRGGQIRSNQKMVERHQKKLDNLYAMTLVNMIDSQYKQVLMKLKSELGSEVRTWDIE